MNNYFIVTRKLTMFSDAVGEYTIRAEIVKEQLEEVLAMAVVDNMELVDTFIHDKHLFLIFKKVTNYDLGYESYKEKVDKKYEKTSKEKRSQTRNKSRKT